MSRGSQTGLTPRGFAGCHVRRRASGSVLEVCRCEDRGLVLNYLSRFVHRPHPGEPMKTATVLILSLSLLAIGSPALAQSKSKRVRVKKLSRVATPTTNVTLAKWVRVVATKVTGTTGRWQLTASGVQMMIITDQRADRMRIISPIASAAKLKRAQLLTLMKANFDRALDAKYAVWRGQVWSTFVHPLSALRRWEFISATKQVAALVKTYGGSFSSIGVVFGGGKKP